MAQKRTEAAAGLHVERNIDHPIAARPSGGNFLRLSGAAPKHHSVCLVPSWSFHPSPDNGYCPRMNPEVPFRIPAKPQNCPVDAHRTGQLLEHSSVSAPSRISPPSHMHPVISRAFRVLHLVPYIPIVIQAPYSPAASNAPRHWQDLRNDRQLTQPCMTYTNEICRRPVTAIALCAIYGASDIAHVKDMQWRCSALYW